MLVAQTSTISLSVAETGVLGMKTLTMYSLTDVLFSGTLAPEVEIGVMVPLDSVLTIK